MNLDPRLSRADRIVTAILGAALVAYALLGDFDRGSIRLLAGTAGAVLLIAWGICGT